MSENSNPSRQGFLPGFEIRNYCLEKALLCDDCVPANGGMIVRIRLTGITIALRDGNGTNVVIRSNGNILQAFQRQFHPLAEESVIKKLCFRVAFQGGVNRTIFLCADHIVAPPDDFTASFERHLVAIGVAE